MPVFSFDSASACVFDCTQQSRAPAEGDPIGGDRERELRYVVLAGTVCAGEPPRRRAR